MSIGAGVSSQIALGNVERNIAEGERQSPEGTGESIARRAFVAPGLSPWGAARLGLGSGNEAGISFTGRSLRVDARHAFEFDRLALSLGLGASSILARRNDAEEGSGGAVLGFGVDVPVLFGWQSRADVVSLWCGVRPSFESLGNFGPADEGEAAIDPRPPTLADATRIGAGGLLGLSVGMHPLWVSLELAATQHWVHANERSADAAGGPDTIVDVDFHAFTLAPAGALLLRF
jgi:hypothetical protein